MGLDETRCKNAGSRRRLDGHESAGLLDPFGTARVPRDCVPHRKKMTPDAGPYVPPTTPLYILEEEKDKRWRSESWVLQSRFMMDIYGGLS
jgi:hypothetical protein